MKVQFSYLDRQFANPEPILKDIKRLVKSGDFTLGRDMELFESEFAKVNDVKYAVGVGSGTDALLLSLKALGIGAGDEVITAVNTFVSTAGAIETSGAKIVFVDCNEKYVIDEQKIERNITSKTKAIIPVHFSGQPANMPLIMDIAKKHDLLVIEDACQAISASINGIKCGNFGLSSAFSFHPLKNLNVWGDAGVIITNSEDLKDKLILMRNHGMVDRDHYAFYAYNSRLDSIQAIVGNHMIKELEKITEKRIRIAHTYDRELSGLQEFISMPERSSNERHVFHLYMLLVKNRDNLFRYLNSNDIEAKIHYPIPLHLQGASKYLEYNKGDFPVSESQAESLITVPAHPYLTDEEVAFTIKKIRQFYSKH